MAIAAICSGTCTAREKRVRFRLLIMHMHEAVPKPRSVQGARAMQLTHHALHTEFTVQDAAGVHGRIVIESFSAVACACATRCDRTFATQMHEPVRTVDNISLIPPIDVYAHADTQLPRTVPDPLGSTLHGNAGQCGAAAGRAGRICGVRPWHLNMCSSGGLEPLYSVAACAYDNTTKYTQV